MNNSIYCLALYQLNFFAVVGVSAKPCALAAPTTNFNMLLIVGGLTQGQASHQKWQEIIGYNLSFKAGRRQSHTPSEGCECKGFQRPLGVW